MAEAEVTGYSRESAARSAIEDGDILMFRGGPLHDRIIEIGTSGTYCHSALAFWDRDTSGERRVFVVQATAARGVHTRLVSEEIHDFEGAIELWRIAKARLPKWDPEKAIRCGLDLVGRPYAMDHVWRFVFDFLTFGVFHLRSHARDRREFFCSQLIALACRKGGVDLAPREGDAATTPSDLVNGGRLEFVRAFARSEIVLALPA